MDSLLSPAVMWFIIGMVMFLIEMATPGLVMLFFGIGAWAVTILILFVDISLNIQLVIFLAVSVLSLVFFRKTLKKVFYGHKTANQDLGRDLDEFIDKKAQVTEAITPGAAGKVEFKGSFWMAESDEALGAGQMVQIISKENLTLKVRKI